MPSERDAGGRGRSLPVELERDYRAFTSELERAAQGGAACAALQELLANTETLDSLRHFALLLYEQSGNLALVARADRPRLFTRHILDSLNPLALFDPPPSSLLDVGSGGGLPGIPLALIWARARVTLLESRERKAGFLERVIRDLELSNARVAVARLRDLASLSSVARVEAVTIRAVGRLPELLREATGIAVPGATWVYFLGTAERAEALIGSIDAEAFAPAARRGALGGWLLTGHFALPGENEALRS
jgi:16S rRNA (guanine527-N7)-methyltransferase